jgi:hypothetical protein
MSELVHIVNQAQEFYNAHTNEVKLVGLTMVLAVIPTYEAVKSVIKKADDWLDKLDQEVTQEQREAMRNFSLYTRPGPYNDLF